jgi:hypothetical protein
MTYDRQKEAQNLSDGLQAGGEFRGLPEQQAGQPVKLPTASLSFSPKRSPMPSGMST